MTKTDQYYAVLTGDIIGSTSDRTPGLEGIQDVLRDLNGDLGSKFSDTLIGSLDIFRGDSWQIGLRQPRSALRVATYIRTFLISRLGVDTRIAIAIDTVERIVDGEISQSSGAAFVASGRHLDKHLGSAGFGLASGPVSSKHEPWMAVMLALYDDLISELSSAQAEAVLILLVNERLSQAELGQRLGISQEAARKRLKSAHWPNIHSVIDLFEQVV